MKTSELTGAALDWAVAKCEGHRVNVGFRNLTYTPKGKRTLYAYAPSTNWAQGGPIIERNLITIFRHDEEWFAHSQLSMPEDFPGDTPLIAAMRCFVASHMGDNIDLPEELT